MQLGVIRVVIIGEPYAFEPFLNGLYGDCGLLLHYDPRAADKGDPSAARPFYMNGEWILEKAHSVGHGEFVDLTPSSSLFML